MFTCLASISHSTVKVSGNPIPQDALNCGVSLKRRKQPLDDTLSTSLFYLKTYKMFMSTNGLSFY